MTRFTRWLPFHRDLGLQLLALYLLFVGPVIAAALIFDGLAGARLEHDVRAADLALARSIALETDAALRNALRTVAVLAADPATGRGYRRARPAVRRRHDRAQRSIWSTCSTSRASSLPLPRGPGSTVGVDFSFRQYYQDARARGSRCSAGRVSPPASRSPPP
jgi:hypothetical protein